MKEIHYGELFYIYVLVFVSVVFSAHNFYENKNQKENINYNFDSETHIALPQEANYVSELEIQCVRICEYALDCMFEKLKAESTEKNDKHLYQTFKLSEQYEGSFLGCIYDCSENMTADQRSCWLNADCSKIKSEQGLSNAICK